MTILEILVLELGQIQTKTSRIGSNDLDALMDALSSYADWNSAEPYRVAREGEEEFLVRLFTEWNADLAPLLNTVGVNAFEGRHGLHSKRWQAILQRLRTIVKPKFGAFIVGQFRENPYFASQVLFQGEHAHRVRNAFLEPDGLLSKDQRSKMKAALEAGKESDIIRSNVFTILEWFDSLDRTNAPEKAQANELLFDPEVGLALWDAAVARPLNARAVGTLLNILRRMKERGLTPTEPVWWSRAVGELQLLSTPPTVESLNE
jgi:hypothetical protein